jgi:hypothetical protein
VKKFKNTYTNQNDFSLKIETRIMQVCMTLKFIEIRTARYSAQYDQTKNFKGIFLTPYIIWRHFARIKVLKKPERSNEKWEESEQKVLFLSHPAFFAGDLRR